MKKLLILAIVIGLIVVAVKMYVGDGDARAAKMAKMAKTAKMAKIAIVAKIRKPGGDDEETPAT